MGVERRRIWTWMGLTLLGAVTVAAVVYIFLARDRDAAGRFVGALVTTATAAIGGAAWLWTRRRPPPAQLSLEHAADQLAEQLRRLWEPAATDRGLLSSTSIPVQWRWSDRPVTGPMAQAVAGGGGGGTRFAPLPGVATITAEQLRSGMVSDLFGVYGGLDSGRLVILGAPGAGKSGAAIRLLLDALTHRSTVATVEERARVPVPVLLSVSGWDPSEQPFKDWLAGRLAREYRLLLAPEYGRDALVRLIEGGRLAVILDGLDEMLEVLRPVALRALDEQAAFRLVVLTRSEELVAAVGGAHLRGAAALELCPVAPELAAEFVVGSQINPLPPPWQRVVNHLREQPGSALAQALGTPLMLTLVRDIYRPGGQVDELTDGERFPSREAIEDHLLGQVLPVAYARRPSQSASPYTLDQAQRWLGHLARQMNEERTRDLAWWQVPRWVPVWPRVLLTTSLMYLVYAFELALALGYEYLDRDGLRYGPAVGLLERFASGFAVGLLEGLPFALLIGLGYGLVSTRRIPALPGRVRRREASLRTPFIAGFIIGFVDGFLSRIEALRIEFGSRLGLRVEFVRDFPVGILLRPHGSYHGWAPDHSSSTRLRASECPRVSTSDKRDSRWLGIRNRNRARGTTSLTLGPTMVEQY